MPQRGAANLSLHSGRAPRWLFERMQKLARSISLVIVDDYGKQELLQRLADPYWFQSLGCVLGFDWHSSGVTTVTMAALKEALEDKEEKLGLFICGGKGKTSLRTPDEINNKGEKVSSDKLKSQELVRATRLAAKVDSSCLQDGFELYHHNFIFTDSGSWAVVQQGMNTTQKKARRYHWFSGCEENRFIEEPHNGIAAWKKVRPLDLTASFSKETRGVNLGLVRSSYKSLRKDFDSLQRKKEKGRFRELELPSHHPVFDTDFKSNYIRKTLHRVCKIKPDDFPELISLKGVGKKTIRALSLVSELIYGAKPSYEDPARYSFAHGGKDGHPRPLDRDTYDNTIAVFKEGIEKSDLEGDKKGKAQKRLQNLF